MRVRRALAAIAATLLLAAPGTALAQSAGDDQYRDPLGGSGGGGGSGSGGSGGGGGGSGGSGGGSDSIGSGSGSGSGSDSGAGSGSGAPADSAGSASGQGGDQLPATGLAAGLLAGTGAVMLGGGAALRRAGRDRR